MADELKYFRVVENDVVKEVMVRQALADLLGRMIHSTYQTQENATSTKTELKTAYEAKDAELEAKITDIINEIDTSLATKDFVNSSIATATATFRGTFVDKADLIAVEADANDYAYHKVMNSDGETVKQYDRYKYSGTGWEFEYTLNSSAFTDAQWKAINSSLTTDDVTNLRKIFSDYLKSSDKSALETKIETDDATTLSSAKTYADGKVAEYAATHQTDVDAFNAHLSDTSNPHSVTKAQVGLDSVENKPMDSAVTENSTNYISSGAVKTYVDSNGGKIDTISVNGTVQEIVNKNVEITVPTKTSDLTNDDNTVKDKDYVHTDNNYTTTEKEKLSGLENYNDTSIKTRLDTLENIVPNEATADNQLADKAFVNSSIATATATFKGTYDSVEALPTEDVTVNDYAFVKVFNEDGSVKQYDRYKYTDKWEFEYTLNNSSFTSEQWSAINSGVTADLVNTITTINNDYLKSADKTELSTAISDEKTRAEGVENGLDDRLDAIEADYLTSADKAELDNDKVDKVEGYSLVQDTKISSYDSHIANNDIHVTLSDKTTWNSKQNLLISGTNIKTINNSSILGEGDITITSGVWGNISGDIEDQTDLTTYVDGKLTEFVEVSTSPTVGKVWFDSDINDTGESVYTVAEIDSLLDNKLDTTEKGAVNGLATLGEDGKVPTSQLPSYVDDVLEYDNLEAFPEEGESAKIYVAKDTNKTYRWSGSAYVEISASIVVGTTSGTALDGKVGTDHINNKENPHEVTAEQVGLGNVANKTLDTVVTADSGNYITSGAVKTYVDNNGGLVQDVQVDGTSVVSNKTANIVLNTKLNITDYKIEDNKNSTSYMWKFQISSDGKPQLVYIVE